MSPRSDRSPFTLTEWAAIAVIVLVWGVNNVAAKVATASLPPLFVGGVRFTLALLMLAPFVRPPFPAPRRLLAIVLLSGPIHFGLIYTGFAIARSVSPLAVSLQLWIPMTALFAWRLLGETMRPAAVAGLVLAFVGVAWMTLSPEAAGDGAAIGLGVIASAAWALATVLVRKTPGVAPLKMQGLTALVAAPLLLGGAFATEPDLVGKAAAAPVIAWAAVAFAAAGSTFGASALLFWLVQRREPGRVTPYFLLTPLVTCSIGVAFLGDRLGLQTILGATATLAGVALVALAERREAKAAEAVMAEIT